MKPTIRNIYTVLYDAFGPQSWWPADNAEEMIIGAILTQNTAWANVERALTALRQHRLLSFSALSAAPVGLIAQHIHPAGYFNQKAKKLKIFSCHIMMQYRGKLSHLLCKPALALRSELLSLWGIGKETADSIILYAAHQPLFVIDAYTIRIFNRLGLCPELENYDRWQHYFQTRLPRDPVLFNEYHALLVKLGKSHCSKRPKCASCPLKIPLECSYAA